MSTLEPKDFITRVANSNAWLLTYRYVGNYDLFHCINRNRTSDTSFYGGAEKKVDEPDAIRFAKGDLISAIFLAFGFCAIEALFGLRP
jgi:hypothetical protein